MVTRQHFDNTRRGEMQIELPGSLDACVMRVNQEPDAADRRAMRRMLGFMLEQNIIPEWERFKILWVDSSYIQEVLYRPPDQWNVVRTYATPE